MLKSHPMIKIDDYKYSQFAEFQHLKQLKLSLQEANMAQFIYPI